MAASALHFRGWLVMGLLSTVLFIAVAVPSVYIVSHVSLVIYTAVVTPVAWLLYVLCMCLFIVRPLQRCTALYRSGVYCSVDDNSSSGSGSNASGAGNHNHDGSSSSGSDAHRIAVHPLTNELYALARHLQSLSHEAGALRAETEVLARLVADGEVASREVAASMAQ